MTDRFFVSAAFLIFCLCGGQTRAQETAGAPAQASSSASMPAGQEGSSTQNTAVPQAPAGDMAGGPVTAVGSTALPGADNTGNGNGSNGANINGSGDISAVNPNPDAQSSESAAASTMERDIYARLDMFNPKIDVNSMPSLFYSLWEHDLLVDARQGVTARIADDDGLQDQGPRDISLAGIVYAAPGEWTIWLNSTRITPSALPKEIMDLKVYKHYIELEWFDAATNQIFPLRLRAHQRFNLDSKIFLPG